MLRLTNRYHYYMCDKCCNEVFVEFPLSSWEYSDDYICPICGDGPDVRLRTIDWISKLLSEEN